MIKLKKAKVKSGGTEYVAVQKKVLVKMHAGGSEVTSDRSYGFSLFPADVPLSQVSLGGHATKNMGDFNSLKISVEASDVCVASPQARRDKYNELVDEVLDLTADFIKRGAKRLFDAEIA